MNTNTNTNIGLFAALAAAAALAFVGCGSGEVAAPAPTTTTTIASTTTIAPTTTTTIAPTTTTTIPPTTTTVPTWSLVRVVDGDTIEVTREGVTETVRLIGIDTREAGECGYDEGTLALRNFLSNQPITLTPGARDDRDKYQRLLRYVDTPRGDANLNQITAGVAVARYDSRDGYGSHPRQDSYVAADDASPVSYPCMIAPVTTAAAASSSGSGSSDSVYYANCAAAKAAGAAPLYAGEPGYRSRLDRDGDGVACES